MSTTTQRYIAVTGRLHDAHRRGADVDHYVDELHGLWMTMTTQERSDVRKLLGEQHLLTELVEVKRAAA